MEYINRIEICGRVLRPAAVTTVGTASRIASLSVVVQEFYKDGSGSVVVEDTWFKVTALDLDRPSIAAAAKIVGGEAVRVKGRVRQRRVVSGVDGTERVFWEIIAQSIEIIKED